MEFSCRKVEGIVELNCPSLVLLNWYLFGRMLFGPCCISTRSNVKNLRMVLGLWSTIDELFVGTIQAIIFVGLGWQHLRKA